MFFLDLEFLELRCLASKNRSRAVFYLELFGALPNTPLTLIAPLSTARHLNSTTPFIVTCRADDVACDRPTRANVAGPAGTA